MNLKNAWKLLPLTGIAALSLLASCSEQQVDGAELLKGLILTEDQGAVQADFDVPDQVQGQTIEWSSSDETVIKFYQTNGDTWAGAIRGATNKTVTMTAKIGEATKDYTVTVNPVDVYEIAESFKLEKEGTQVADIEITLPSTYTYSYTTGALAEAQTYQATLTWTSSNEDYIKIEDGKAKIGTNEQRVNVNLVATFSYGTRTSRSTFKYIVCKKYTQSEIFYQWYNEPKNEVSYDIEGYVSYITADHSTQYNNVTYMFVATSDLTGGYMFYRPSMVASLYEQLTVGTPIKITGKSTKYAEDSNGVLIQGNSGATVSIDNTKTKIDPSQIPSLAIDSEVAVNSDSLIYRQNSHVSLTGWKVKSNDGASATGSSTTQTALTLEKNGQTIKVGINSKVTPLAGEVATSLFSTLSGIKAGDIVDVKGYLSYDKGHVIFADKTTSITKVTTESTVDSSLVAVSTAKTDLDAAIKATNVNTTHTEAGTFTLPTTQGTYNVTYSLGGTYDNATLATNVLTITPVELAGKVVLIAKLAYTENDVNKTVTLKYSFDVESSIPFVLEAGSHTESISYDSYTNAGNNNLAEGDNHDLGLTEVVTITSLKNNGSYLSSVYVDTTSNLRLSKDKDGGTNGSQLTFEFAYEGFTITVTSVKITYTAANYSKGLIFKGGDAVVTDSDTNADDLISVYNMTDVSKFSIQAGASNVRILSMEITYTAVANATK